MLFRAEKTLAITGLIMYNDAADAHAAAAHGKENVFSVFPMI